jgi:hypothetical protein
MWMICFSISNRLAHNQFSFVNRQLPLSFVEVSYCISASGEVVCDI